jgi:hypothetical protein
MGRTGPVSSVVGAPTAGAVSAAKRLGREKDRADATKDSSGLRLRRPGVAGGQAGLGNRVRLSSTRAGRHVYGEER